MARSSRQWWFAGFHIQMIVVYNRLPFFMTTAIRYGLEWPLSSSVRIIPPVLEKHKMWSWHLPHFSKVTQNGERCSPVLLVIVPGFVLWQYSFVLSYVLCHSEKNWGERRKPIQKEYVPKVGTCQLQKSGYIQKLFCVCCFAKTYI